MGAISFSKSSDLILDLEGSESLMVEHLANLSAVESEVRVHEVDERNSAHEDQQPGVVSLSLGVKRIITKFVTVRQVVHVVLLLEGVAV